MRLHFQIRTAYLFNWRTCFGKDGADGASEAAAGEPVGQDVPDPLACADVRGCARVGGGGAGGLLPAGSAAEGGHGGDP